MKTEANSGMNSGQLPWKIQVNPSAEFEGQLFSWKLRLTLELKIKANSWNEFRSTPPRKIQVNPSAEF